MTVSNGADTSANTLTADAKLNFLRDYLIRSRFDALTDKGTLTQLYYAKIVACGGAISLAPTSIGAMALTLLPFVIFSLDFMHKKRFIEIFLRWEHVTTYCIPMARNLKGFWSKDEFKFLEEQVVELKDQLASEEGLSRAILAIAASALSAPAFVITAERFFHAPKRYAIPLMILWALIVLMMFWATFINSEKYRATYPKGSWSVPIGLLFAVGSFSLLSLAGYDIVTALEQALSPIR